ncbi:SLAP domain-containing protein [Oceanobacillus sp. 143]|jgi:SLAP domain-containing protein|uniref:SLAP domain-containing protein n=1 Tax=Oceanobacillus zhaokaii TaxID=2052660 RepID=A0A345PIF8_9BACI|nr:SLAP domain-containing protein [Oceanobacillus zhaokaii]AXI09788.1 SLAP domain-containing protein [Oceanobacillus zhaokaii]QGS69066.1 SLAP domain-containing protein [Oceanobacillus sp. 143]
MQKLLYEPTWDKALSDKDRTLINRVFLETKASTNNKIEFSKIREAFNHKGELLVMVLIHNSTKVEFVFKEEMLHYVENDIVIAAHVFTLPSLISEPGTSMPWTFIFPVETLRSMPALNNGKLEFAIN